MSNATAKQIIDNATMVATLLENRDMQHMLLASKNAQPISYKGMARAVRDLITLCNVKEALNEPLVDTAMVVKKQKVVIETLLTYLTRLSSVDTGTVAHTVTAVHALEYAAKQGYVAE